ncbi:MULTISPECIES: phosphoglucomutase/phosphomannomutase family protein [unclassified Desulfurobacterium]|uniref:phosphoglucomutase/phosphomannomutase family protein n=1 Tax=Desulfurobacterium sp. TC5-1 TaxID=1158318 RepID=UPI0003B3D79E|nr:phosphoglucomutase/phosphomannomutase family protein [Desulfurobacterium sp. TC5-1]
MAIKFGTDGWRGVIADDFTFENLRKVTQAHAKVLKEDGAKRIVVGYDMRFLSPEFGKFVAETLSGEGFEVVLADTFSPTPAVSFATKYMNFDNGIVITASHNYGKYSGYKVKESFGGAATTAYVKRIEKYLPDVESAERKAGEVKTEDINTPYIEAVRNQIDLSLFKERAVKIVHDPMFGAQQNFVSQALKGTKAEVTEIHSYRDPLFDNKHPEPIVEKNIKSLMEKVRAVGADIGIANDGDGDRVGIVDENGNFVNSQIVYALILLHVLKNKGLRGGCVVKTVSTGYLVNRVCEDFGIELVETPVGFKNITEVMLKRKVLFGGEESGGYALMDYLPERDGLLMGLFIVEKMLVEGKSLSKMVEELFERYGSAYYRRIDLPVSEEEKAVLNKLKENPPEEVEGKKVKKALTIDGLKLIFEDDSWLLFRPSGTEPVFRTYAEAPTPEEVEKLIQKGVNLIKGQ